MEQPKYNYIFKKLVEDNNDIIGSVAYAFYKQQKLEYIERYNKEHGHDPDDKAIADFHIMSGSDSAIAAYKKQAESVFNEVLDSLYEQHIKARLDEAVEETKQSVLMREIENISSLKSMALNGLVGGIVSAVLVALLTLVIWFSNQDLIAWLSKNMPVGY